MLINKNPTGGATPHNDLHQLCTQLRAIHSSVTSFEPPTPRPPIIDASTDIEGDDEWKQQENISGMRLLRDAVKGDLERLEAFLADPNSANLPGLSTNSPYLISVWNEVICAPSPLVSIFRSFPIESSPQNGTPTRKDTGVKVDVICDGGRQWIRVNTIKNSRMLAEFREIDSYLTDSSDSDSDSPNIPRPSLAQKEFDNSVLRMARSLLSAANQNLIPGTSNPPKVTLRLTRLEPTEEGVDPRIAETVQCLLDMGIDVQLGERAAVETPIPSKSSSGSKPYILEPTTRVNLDLSILIALISDLTHADLPNSPEEADARFLPSKKYLEWKKGRINQGFSISGAGKKNKQKGKEKEGSISNDPHRLPADKPWKNVHARALAHQLKQETRRGLLRDMSERLSAITPPSTSGGTALDFMAMKGVEFWTTQDARDRCLRIISKIGGPNERRRADALFSSKSTSDERSEERYWFQSRYPPGYVPLLPLRIYPSHEPHDGGLLEHPLQLEDPAYLSPFFSSLAQTCRWILSHEILPHPRALPDHLVEGDVEGEIQRAEVTKANPKLTAHTVQSMLWGAELGWTTLTANKSSVKAILREMKQQQSHRAEVKEPAAERSIQKAAFWVVDPRSLAEGQRADLDDE